MAVLEVMGTSPLWSKAGVVSRRGADMAVPHVGRKHLQGNAMAVRSLCSGLVVRGALPLAPRAEGPLPAQVLCPSPLPGQSANVPPGASSAMGLEGMFHCCQTPGQHQIKWTGRTVAQSLTITWEGRASSLAQRPHHPSHCKLSSIGCFRLVLSVSNYI